jgi:glycosyltransferase involved in cell wall biosynthesis
MAAGNCVLVNDHPPNAETVSDAGIYFSGRGGADALCAQLRRLLDDERLVAEYRERARRRAAEFSWEAVADQYERLLTDVYEAARPGALPESLLESGTALAT